MSKIKKIFNSLLLGICAVSMASVGLVFSDIKIQPKDASTDAQTIHEQVTNNLQEFVKIQTTGEKTEDDVVFLMNSDHTLSLSIAKDNTITNADNKSNYAYIPNSQLNNELDVNGNKNIKEYYYFNFPNSLSLYYDSTNLDIDDSVTTLENLLSSEDIKLFAGEHENAFPLPTYDLTPQKLNIQFKLNPSQSENCKILTQDSVDSEGNPIQVKTSTVSVKREGCYTLAIPMSYFYTNNGGETFVTTSTVTYYTFMLFNYTSYYDSESQLPLANMSNVHEALLSNSTSHSKYYFYNYTTSALPAFSYDPSKYQATIQYTDTDSKTVTAIVDCNTLANTPTPTLIDSNGQQLAKPFAYTSYKKINGNDNLTLTFPELGEYDISFTFLYKTNTRIFEIPLKAKNQRLLNFGYQSYYTDYSMKDGQTNIAESKPFKGVSEDKLNFINSADITPLLTNENVTVGTKDSYSAEATKEAAINIINSTSKPNFPVSTNQTPIKFITNATLTANLANSKIYSLSKNENNWQADSGRQFDGLNLNEAGTYLVVIDYTYNRYLASNGVAQSTFHHQQVFFFTIENTAPTITTVDETGKEIKTRGYTNKNVYVVDNSASSLYDAQVTIKISATNYLTGVQFLPETEISYFKNPAFGITYSENLIVPGMTDDNGNDLIQTGIMIDASSRNAYRNSTFTITIYFANSTVPSSSSFTIDTTDITNLVAKNVSYSTSSSYTIGSTVTSDKNNGIMSDLKRKATGKTDGPIVFSWEHKASGAQTYGYYKYFKLSNLKLYNADNSLLLYNLIGSREPYGMIPVEARIDLNQNANWVEYYNARDYDKIVPSTYVRDQAGLYFLEVYDEAGNADFAIFLIDNTSPIFVETIATNSGTTRKILGSNDTIMVSSTITKASIDWAKYKGIRLEVPSELNTLKETYAYDELTLAQKSKLGQVIDEFLSEDNTMNLPNISGATPPEESDLKSYKGTYLKIEVNDYFYFKHATSSKYTQKDGISYEITLIDENDEAVEGTYKFLLCDYSNSHFTRNPLTSEHEFLNFPSSFLTINVTSDMSRMEVLLNDAPLDKEGYTLTGKFYKHNDVGTNNYTLEKESTSKNENITVSPSNFTYKYQYYVPERTEQELTLSFIPLSETAAITSQVANVKLTYYPFVKVSKDVKYDTKDGEFTAKVYYYTIAEEPSHVIDVFNYSETESYTPGKTFTFNLSFSGSKIASPGKYVISRRYQQNEANVDKYDFFERTSTLIIDRYNVLSMKESINNEIKDPDTNQIISSNTSLESIVGGDMLVSMYSGKTQSSLQIAFPSYNPNTGLNEGSFYTSPSFDENTIISESLITNKLPLEVKIPKYKYTTNYVYDKLTNSYKVFENNSLSRFGDAEIKIVYDFTNAEVKLNDTGTNWIIKIDDNVLDGLYKTQENAEAALEIYKKEHISKYHVFVEGILAKSCDTLSEAERYFASTEIEEYKLKATIILYKDGQDNKIFTTNGTTTDGYLNFYQVDSVGSEVPENAIPVVFTEAGTYNVTIYQASNLANTPGSFTNFYRFNFVVKQPTPDFGVYNDGKLINSIGANEAQERMECYYSNTPNVTISWSDDTSRFSKFIANLDKTRIQLTYPDNRSKMINLEDDNSPYKLITDGTNHSFNLNLKDEGIWNNQSYLTITMWLEGDDGNNDIYTPLSKRIYVDYTAPFGNLSGLMESVTNSYSWFNRFYQEINMRTLYDCYGNEIDTSNWLAENINTLMQEVSYSYTTTNTIFNKYSYNVPKDFFTLLQQSITSDARQVQNIYIKEIIDFDKYIQVTAGGFSENEYEHINDFIFINENSYYEIVEMDTAGNMVVYIVNVFEPDNYKVQEDSTGEEFTIQAIEYKNGSIGFEKRTDSDISQDYSIYSKSGFQITGLNYLSDPWGLYRFSVHNSYSNIYMKSPWLNNNQIYLIGLSGSKLTFSVVNLADIYANATSSTYKHHSVFIDRYQGTSKDVHIAIMDADLTTSKYSDGNTASLNISVPTFEQATSTTLAFTYPVKVKISTHNGEWKYAYEGENYTGNPTLWLGNDSIQIQYQNGILTFKVILGTESLPISQKLKYEIVDNFGYTTTIIQIVNEENIAKEVVSESKIYESNETDGSKTYLTASNQISYQYNSLIYKVEVWKYDKVNQQFVQLPNYTSVPVPNTSTIRSYNFTETSANYDSVYQVRLYDAENYNNIENNENRKSDRVINLRLYNKLPVYQTDSNTDNGASQIYLQDKNNERLTKYTLQKDETIITIGNKIYSTHAYSFTTYSNNVTAVFTNGQFNSENQYDYTYLNQYNYSVYFSSDEGKSWTNINDFSSSYRISGTGNYKLLMIYDSNDILNEECLLIDINILDSSRILYHVMVDGIITLRSDIKYTAPDNSQIDEVYLLSVNYSDKNDRVKVEANKELDIQLSGPQTIVTGTNVYVDVYSYESVTSKGRFAIIYIGKTNSILTTLNYEDSLGSPINLLETNNVNIVASDTQTDFSKLKISWTPYYGIQENAVNIEVLKYFNNEYTKIDIETYYNGTNRYAYLTRSGTYRIRFTDSCADNDKNVQLFKGSEYISLIFLKDVPFIVTYTNPEGEEIVTEPITRAVYNSEVKLSLTNLSSYFQTSGYPTISVTKDGKEYNVTPSNYVYSFTETGYYVVKFAAVSSSGVSVRQEEFIFSIINANESRFAYEFPTYSTYYITKVIKNGVDITENLVRLAGNNVVYKNGKPYLSSLLTSFFDERTGSGRYIVTINTGEQLQQILTNEFTFAFWINLANPPVKVSIEQGGSTTDNIVLSFNAYNLHDAVGDCYIQIASDRYEINADTVDSIGGNNASISITRSGTYYIQIYSTSNNLLFSYKVTKTDPMNAWTIIAIVLAVVAAIAITVITILLRKRLKVK